MRRRSDSCGRGRREGYLDRIYGIYGIYGLVELID
jgi:hypothetical protein